MSIEADIHDALDVLAPGRVYPDLAPDDVGAEPYIVYQQVGGEVATFLERAQPSKKNGRFQIAVWGEDRIEVGQLVVQVDRLMTESTAFQAKPLGGAIALHDPATDLRGARQDFSVWSDQ